MRKRQVTVRIARWSAKRPWTAIGLWTLFVAVCLGAMSMGFTLATPTEIGQGESGRAAQTLDDKSMVPATVENILISADGGTFDRAAATRAATAVRDRARGLAEVESVGEAVPARDGASLLVPVTLSGDPVTADQRIQPVLGVVEEVRADFPALRIDQAGAASIQAGINDQLGADFVKAEVLSIPVTLIIMMVAFGAIIAAGVPVLLALTSVGAAMGLWAICSQVMPDPGQVPNMILLMGMAVGVDYSLFYLKRARQERARGAGPIDAIEIAAATSGHSVVVSGLAVIVSMAALYLSNDLIFSSLATGSILVVAVAVVGSLTVLPALLAKLGRWIDKPRVPILWRINGRNSEPRLWPALLRPVLRHPAITLVLSVAALLAMAFPALDLQLKSADIDDYPRSIPALSAYDRVTEAFPAKGTSHEVVVTAEAGDASAVEAALVRLTDRAQTSDLFAPEQDPQPRTSADGTVHVINLATPYPANTAEAERSVRLLRDELIPATVGQVGGARTDVGGEVANSIDYSANVAAKLPWVVGLVLLLTFIVMIVSFRSVVVGLVALLVNLLSAAAAFGLLVAIFQNEWAEGILDFRSNGAIVSWIPLFLFVVLFGLSMDYHVFVVSSIKEAAQTGVSIRQAVSEGISRSAGIVTSAAIVMVSVFAIFATLSLIEFKQLGLGLALAVLLDALVIRGIVLPALMTLLGRGNWWPGKLPVAPSAPPDRRRRPDALPAGRGVKSSHLTDGGAHDAGHHGG
ncbi:MMPL family transporter [Actinoplanes missouriensis]|uniref:MMPL family transporter n=1 Tax=Actinoplanes missouriensis TaxID=1866 RepID=UPI0012F71FE6|nr:MMPL family transporter [Actinoplanes missouriensis]